MISKIDLCGECVSIEELVLAWRYWKQHKELESALKELQVQMDINKALSDAFNMGKPPEPDPQGL